MVRTRDNLLRTPSPSSSLERTESYVRNETDDMGPVMKPTKFFFDHTKFGEVCRITTRCNHKKTVDHIESILTESELMWFKRHDQFKHLFHMPRHGYRRVAGMYMLLLRTVQTNKKKECWFVVNGVPIRYSMREHALLSGLDCKEYPLHHEQLGSFEFVQRWFGREKKICITDIKDKLDSMATHGEDRLKMAVLYLLTTVLKGKTVNKRGNIEPFLLRVVDNLQVCETFPWGRFSFLNIIEEINHLIEHFNGAVQDTWTFPGFILPLEVLAYECIPQLGRTFRKDVFGADNSCPRLCKSTLKKKNHKGISLKDIYDVVGTTKDIYSLLEPELDEIPLLDRLMDEVVDDVVDPIPDYWMRSLSHNNRSVWWEDLYKKDVQSRAGDVEEVEHVQPDERGDGDDVHDGRHGEIVDDKLKALEEKMREKLKAL